LLARAHAFAKINRSLEILGVRPDGFHELRTVFQSIALHDTLTIRASRGSFQLTCDDPDCPPDRSNLIWRAAERVWKAAGRRGSPRDLSIHLAKRIPLQAGLGGGSSDAAAALRALGRLWRVDPDRVRAIGLSLGADIPYFFEGGTVLGLERGDLLYPLVDAPRQWVVLAVPSFGVSTKDAFAWWDHDVARPFPASARSDPGRASARLAEAPEARRRQGRGRGRKTSALQPINDLQPVVAKRYPEVGRLVRALERAGALHAAMTGAGSAVFGLFSTRAMADRAAAQVLRRGCRAVITRTVDRAACQALAVT
jgi:4-diphosphocytidyl-2-C-methyl-D-erythritol kinase